MAGAHQQHPGFSGRSLAYVFATLAALFGATTLAANWYLTERSSRASEYFREGKTLESRGDLGAAIEAYRNALEISPASEYRLALAQALVRSGRPEAASAYLAELLRSDVASGEPNLLLARIAGNEGQTNAAVSYYQRAIYGYWPHDSQKNRMNARWELVGLLERKHMQKQVTAQLLELSEQAPGDVPLLLDVANRLLEHNAASQAAEIFREALRVEPKNGQAQAGLAEAELGLSQYEGAQTAFRRAIRDGDDNEQVRRAYEMVSEVLALDPLREGLSPIERYHRSLQVLERSEALVASCARPAAAEPLLAKAKQAQAAHIRPGTFGSSTDSNIALAEQLYSLKGDCAQSDAALGRVLARIKAK